MHLMLPIIDHFWSSVNDMKTVSQNTWFLHERMKVIEIVLVWEERLTTNHLQSYFGITRMQASRDIKHYSQLSNQITYDYSARGYKPTPDFTPLFISLDVHEYMNYAAKLNDEKDGFTKIIPPTRFIEREFVRTLISAIKGKMSVRIHYSSLSSGELVERLIHPHTLVDSHIRWHIRAYCELREGFRDFNLSRMVAVSQAIEKTPEQYQKQSDVEWMTEVKVNFIPKATYSPQQKKILLSEHFAEDGQIQVISSEALLNYDTLLYSYEWDVLDEP